MSVTDFAELQPVEEDGQPLDDLLDIGPVLRPPSTEWEKLGGHELAEGVWEFDGFLDPLELVESLEGQALSKFEEQHPRWPKGTPKAGQFMHVGDRFSMGGDDYEVAHIHGGQVVAHLETHDPKAAKTIVLNPQTMGVPEGKAPAAPTAAALPHEADVVGGISAPSAKSVSPISSSSSAKPIFNLVTVDPYVDTNSHAPSIPLPTDSPISPEEWKRFGAIDQANYVRLMKKYGKYSPSATKKHLDASYGKYDHAVQQLVKQAFKSQYGSSSGWTLNLASLFKKGGSASDHAKLLAQREKAKQLQGEVADAVQWDLYSRTRSPDVVLFHKSSQAPSWWESTVFSGHQPAFSGLSQSFRFDANWGFGSTTVMTPLAIRHVTMSSFSAQPVPGETHFVSELEVAAADQLALKKGKSLVVTKGSLTPNQFSWLQKSTHEPHGGAMFDQFKEALDTGKMLPTPPAAASISMEGDQNGKNHLLDALPHDLAQRVNAVNLDAAGQPLPKATKFSDLAYDAKTPEGSPQPANTLELHPGDLIRGKQGALYVIVHDPEDSTGWGFARIELDPMTGKPNGKIYNFGGQGTSPFYKLNGHVDLPPPEKKNGGPEFVPTAWANSAESKFLQEFQVGEKFKVNGNPYEVVQGAVPNGYVKIQSLDTGKLGQINGDFKTSWLIPNEEAAKGPKLTIATPKGVKNDASLGESLVYSHAAGGSTGAAFYKAPDGSQWVVKHYGHDEDRLATEALANSLLAHLGMNAPETVLTKVDGKPVIATRAIEGGTKSKGKWTATDKQAVADQFVAHALIGNWDVVGLVHDNVIHGPSGATPIDQGGSFMYRAQGDKKEFTGDSIPELESLRDPHKNASAADVFGSVTNTQIQAQAHQIVESLSPEAIHELVKSAGFKDKAMQTHVEAALVGRLEHLQSLAPGAVPGGKLLQYEMPGGAPTPKPGMVVAYGGKKATVTKILKDGSVQLNLSPGVVKLDPSAVELQGLHDPLAYTVGDKSKLSQLVPGQKFHGGTGAKVKPYEVIEQEGKFTLVRNVESGAVSKLSASKSYAVLNPKPADGIAPAQPDTPTSTPGPPVGDFPGGEAFKSQIVDIVDKSLAASTHDPAHYDLGDAKVLEQIPIGGKYEMNGWHYQVTGKTEDGHIEVTNLQTGASKPLAGALNSVKVNQLVKKEEGTAASVPVSTFNPDHYESGEYASVSEIGIGGKFLYGASPHQIVGTNGDGHYEVTNLVTGVTMPFPPDLLSMKVVPLVKKDQLESGQLVPAVDGFDPTKYDHGTGEVTKVSDMEIGTIFKTPKGGLYKLTQKGDKWATGTNLMTGKPYPIKLADGKHYMLLTPKSEASVPTPYHELKQGDTTTFGMLQKGDQFKIPGNDLPHVVMAVGSEEHGVPATIAALGPNGSVISLPGQTEDYGQQVTFHAHAGEGADTLPSSGDPVNVEDLPSAVNFATDPSGTPVTVLSGYAPATDELFQPYKSTHGPGGAYKHDRIKEMAPGTIFQDKGGKQWKVKQNTGAFGAVITDGKNLFKVDENLRGKTLQGSDAYGFQDTSPALGSSADWEHSAVEQNLVLGAGIQLGDLQPGDFFKNVNAIDGQPWKITKAGLLVHATNVQTGEQKTFDPSAVPTHVAQQGTPVVTNPEELGAGPMPEPPQMGAVVNYSHGGSVDTGQVVGVLPSQGVFTVKPSDPSLSDQLHHVPIDSEWSVVDSEPVAPSELSFDASKNVPAAWLSPGDHFQFSFDPNQTFVIDGESDSGMAFHNVNDPADLGELDIGDHVIPAANATIAPPGEWPISELALGHHFESEGATWKVSGAHDDGIEAEMVQPGGPYSAGQGWKAGHVKEFGYDEMVAPMLRAPGGGTPSEPAPTPKGTVPDGMEPNDGGWAVSSLVSGDHFTDETETIWKVENHVPNQGTFTRVVYSPDGSQPVGKVVLYTGNYVPSDVQSTNLPGYNNFNDPGEPPVLDQKAATFSTAPSPLDAENFDPKKLTKTGVEQKVSEMDPGAIWQSPKGGYYQKLGETTVLNKNGAEQKAWLVKDLQTGVEKKTVAFALAGKTFPTFSYPESSAPSNPASPVAGVQSPSEFHESAGPLTLEQAKPGDVYGLGSSPGSLFKVISKDEHGLMIQKVFGPASGATVMPIGGLGQTSGSAWESEGATLFKEKPGAPSYLPLKGDKIWFQPHDEDLNPEGNPMAGEVANVGNFTSGNPYWTVTTSNGDVHVLAHDELLGPHKGGDQWFVHSTDPETGAGLVTPAASMHEANMISQQLGGTATQVSPDGTIIEHLAHDEGGNPAPAPASPQGLAPSLTFSNELSTFGELPVGSHFQYGSGGSVFQKTSPTDLMNVETGEQFHNGLPLSPIHAEMGAGTPVKLDGLPGGGKMSKIPADGLTVFRTEHAHEAYKSKTSFGSGLYFGTDKQATADLQLDPESEDLHAVGDAGKVDTWHVAPDAKLLDLHVDDLNNQQLQDFSGESLKAKALAAGYDGVRIHTESANFGGDQIVLFNADKAYKEGEPSVPDFANPFSPNSTGDAVPQQFTRIDRQLLSNLMNAQSEDQHVAAVDAIEQHLESLGPASGYSEDDGTVNEEHIDAWANQAAAHFGLPYDSWEHLDPSKFDPYSDNYQGNPFADGATGGIPTTDDAAKQGVKLGSLQPGDSFTYYPNAPDPVYWTVAHVDPVSNEVAYSRPGDSEEYVDHVDNIVHPKDTQAGIPTPKEPNQLADQLQPFQSTWGSGGKYKHEQVGTLTPGTWFTDKSKQSFMVVGHDNGVTHYIDKNDTSYSTASTGKVKVQGGVAPQSDSQPKAAVSVMDKALAAHGSIDAIPAAHLQGYASAYGSGGTYKHPKLSELQPGTQFVDKGGNLHTFVGLSGGKAVVHSSTGYGTEPAATKVKTHGTGTSAFAEPFDTKPKPPSIPGQPPQVKAATLKVGDQFVTGFDFDHEGNPEVYEVTGHGDVGKLLVKNVSSGSSEELPMPKDATVGKITGAGSGGGTPTSGTPAGKVVKGKEFTPSEAEAAWHSWGAVLSPSEVEALSLYQGEDHMEINEWLREGKPPKSTSAWVAPYVKEIDEAMTKSSMPKDGITYRGVSHPKGELGVSDDPEELKDLIGAEFVQDGYSSTTIDKLSGHEWAGIHGVVLRITVPKGSKGAYMPAKGQHEHNGEKELLLPRGTKYRIAGVSNDVTKYGQPIVDVIVVDESTKGGGKEK